MVGKQDALVVFCLLFIIVALALFQSDQLELGLNLAGFDPENDFWGGMLVEMIGVSVELGLIIFVLTRASHLRWAPARMQIKTQFSEALRSEVRETISCLRSVDALGPWAFQGPRMNGINLTAALNKRFQESEKRATRLSDYLQYSNNAFTPDMASAVASFMVSLEAYRPNINDQSYFDHPDDLPKGAIPVSVSWHAFFSHFRELHNLLSELKLLADEGLLNETSANIDAELKILDSTISDGTRAFAEFEIGLNS